jgi:myo-inositol-1(or 4)-monophosphatase
MSEYLSLALRAAASGAEILLGNYLSDARVLDSGGKDIKTLADVAAQECIVGILAESGLPILAEEGDGACVTSDSLHWIVDPLDGTYNFTRGFPVAAISIALWDGKDPVLGVIRDLFARSDYSGIVGEGAWLDGNSIEVSTVDETGQAALATGFPSGRSYDDDSLKRFIASVQGYKKIRMLGSAAMMLAHVAAGRFDAYEEEDIYLWDVAGGLALVLAAGGKVSVKPGSGPNKFRVRATNGRL